MNETIKAARRRFEQDRSRAALPIHLTVQQLDRAAEAIGIEAVVPSEEERSALDRALFPQDELVHMATCIATVRDEPARAAERAAEVASVAAERERLRSAAIEKLGLTEEQARALFGG